MSGWWNLVSLIIAIVPIASSIGYVGIRWAIRPIELKLEAHLAEDAVIQPQVHESLQRLEGKLDKLMEWLLHHASQH